MSTARNQWKLLGAHPFVVRERRAKSPGSGEGPKIRFGPGACCACQLASEGSIIYYSPNASHDILADVAATWARTAPVRTESRDEGGFELSS